MSYIKNTKDLVLGVGLLIMGLWLALQTTTKGFVLAGTTVFLARPDVYVRLIAWGLVILSTLLILKSLNLTGKKEERIKFSFNLPLVTILPMVGFIVYTLVLEKVGFFISTFVFMTFICFVYQLKEKGLTLKGGKEVIKSFAISCGFSLIMVVILGEAFIRLLKVVLP